MVIKEEVELTAGGCPITNWATDAVALVIGVDYLNL